MKLSEQRSWYENWHRSKQHTLPVEKLKQSMRLFAIESVLAHIDYTYPLVIGCGQGDELQLLNADSIIAFDLALSAVRSAQTLVDGHYMQADAMKLPFKSDTFDLVLSSEVVEHVLHPEQMLIEIARVLRPGGTVVLTTPNWLSFFGVARWAGETLLRRSFTSDEQPIDHWSTPASLAALLRGAGFQVIAKRGAWYFPPTGVRKYRLNDNVMASIFSRLLPIELWLQRTLPGVGHMLVVAATLTSK